MRAAAKSCAIDTPDSQGEKLGGAVNAIALARVARPFALPVVFVLGIILSMDDPTYRFPLLAFVLPFLQRAAVRVLKPISRRLFTKGEWRLSVISFGTQVFGWTVFLGVIVFAVASEVPGVFPTGAVVQRSIVIGCMGFVIAAWYWWPFYLNLVLETQRHADRVFVQSSARWDVLLRTYQMQKLIESPGIRWRGFGSVAGIIATLLVLSTLGVYPGVLPLILELLCVATLIALHLVVVREADALIEGWAEVYHANAESSRE